jgi:hypothetical protein
MHVKSNVKKSVSAQLAAASSSASAKSTFSRFCCSPKKPPGLPGGFFHGGAFV